MLNYRVTCTDAKSKRILWDDMVSQGHSISDGIQLNINQRRQKGNVNQCKEVNALKAT